MAAAQQPGLHLTHEAPSPREAQDTLTPAGASRELTTPCHCPATELWPLPPTSSKDPHRACFRRCFAQQNRPILSWSTAGSRFKDCSVLETSGNGLRPFLGSPNMHATQACARDAAQLGRGGTARPPPSSGGRGLSPRPGAGGGDLWPPVPGPCSPQPTQDPTKRGRLSSQWQPGVLAGNHSNTPASEAAPPTPPSRMARGPRRGQAMGPRATSAPPGLAVRPPPPPHTHEQKQACPPPSRPCPLQGPWAP